MKKQTSFALALFISASVLGAVSSFAASQNIVEAPAIGDVENGARLWKKSSKKSVKINGNWANKYSDGQMKRALTLGKGGFPKLKSANALDVYDVVALVRAKNSNLDLLVPDASHVLLGKGVLDEYALERLTEAKVETSKKDKKRRVFALFNLKDRANYRSMKRVKTKHSKMRDKLTPKKGVAFAVFLPLKGFRDGSYEVGFVVDRDIKILQVIVRNSAGDVPDDLNRAASRFKGRSARGKYKALKLPGKGKAIRELQKPLSDAFLRGMESVYMYEVEEREHFEFFED
ncbi:MAG: hypothetical protein GY822_10370 [Deltaproteobacteria bacterium]|nr:hypothetical protein [Deltaproteobacteria bacterium]